MADPAPIDLASQVLPGATAAANSDTVEIIRGGRRMVVSLAAVVALSGGGGGAVASVNGYTGTVVLAASDVGADASGAATAAQAAAIAACIAQPTVVAASLTAANGANYSQTASATYTDPTGVSGKGYWITVQAGTATVGGTAYAVAGTELYRYYNGSAWVTLSYLPASAFANRTAVACTGGNTTIAATQKVTGISSISSSSTFTLPAANSLPAGTELIVEDDSGSLLPTVTATINRAGSDTINGGTTGAVMSAPYQKLRFITDGTSAWTVDNVYGSANAGSGMCRLDPSARVAVAQMPDPTINIQIGPEDYLGAGVSGWVSPFFPLSSSGGGSASAASSTGNHQGIGQLVLGTTSGTGVTSSTTNKEVLVGQGVFTWQAITGALTLGSASADGVFMGGLFDSLGAPATEPANGIYFRYEQGVNSGKLQAVCANAGTRTQVDLDTPYTVNAATFFNGTIVVAADLSSAKFYLAGALVKTITTNLPANSILMYCGISLWRNGAGAVSMTWYVDFQTALYTLTAAR